MTVTIEVKKGCYIQHKYQEIDYYACKKRLIDCEKHCKIKEVNIAAVRMVKSNG